jgi:dTDP-4-amino-4,6-dideoxygalactose transaminase
MIPYGRQEINDDDVAAVVDVLRGDWLTTGPTVARFEESLRRHTGGVPCVAVSSGTAALHAAYAAAGLGPGDEVITPPVTFVATQAALVHLGATPVFADVESDSANIDPRAVEAAIGPRTAAIVAVDYAGHPADMDALRTVASKHGLLLIEDAAHSLGSAYRGRAVGTLADITTFSFFPTKNITTCEGGAVASAQPDLLEKARLFSRQGLIRDPDRFLLRAEGLWHQEVHEVGLNYRMSDVQAALGVSQLSRLEMFKTRRAEIKALYDSMLENLSGVEIPPERSDVRAMWHLYPVRVPASKRAEVFTRMRQSQVGVQVNYLPAYRHPALSHLGRPSDFPNSEDFYSREISLPIHTGLTNEDVLYVARSLENALRDKPGVAVCKPDSTR